MKLEKYLKDKLYIIILFFISYLLILLMLLAFSVEVSLIIAISIVIFCLLISIIMVDYLRKREFYNNLVSNTKNLDQSYLVLETITKPSFYEGVLLCSVLYDIDKSMCENVNKYREQMNNFKEYIEMWIHEVKIPLATLTLMSHNNKDNFDEKILTQIKRIDDYVEQVLYYVRGENASVDYLIKEVDLNKIIGEVLLRNKDIILRSDIELIVENLDVKVLTDSKWLEFILNQIISNSIKYKKDRKGAYIKIFAKDDGDKILLTIEDNGIGINEADLPRVFDKSFTGYNGRVRNKSTGMGLFIAKSLSLKLGHKISIDSKVNKYTRVTIIFSKDNYYSVIKD